jgi:hypothetical protein
MPRCDPPRCVPHALRLLPGEDLRRALERHAARRGLRAGFVLTAVGSLACACLRLAGAQHGARLAGPFEIVSLVGTLARDGAHLHAALAGADGAVIGGHLLHGCEILTTAEVVLGELPGTAFARRPDARTGYRELVIAHRRRRS